MEHGGLAWPAQGMTIRDILEKVDLFNIEVEDESKSKMKKKNMEKNSEGKTVIQVSDPTSAYLGPKLWDKQININFGDETETETNDIMNMEEFLAENNISLGALDGEEDTNMEVGSPANKYMGLINPDSPDSPDAIIQERKPVIRPSIIVNGKEGERQGEARNVLPKGDNVFLYAESKRARLEREKEERKKKLELEMDFAPEDLALATVPGMDFNPKERAFNMEELRPQPIIRKRKKTFVPDAAKDEKYWENRFKNNVAARRSREARRLKENQIALRAAYLERENRILKKELEDVNFANSKLNTEKEILKIKLSKYEGNNA